jgi:hypothetical protein
MKWLFSIIPNLILVLYLLSGCFGRKELHTVVQEDTVGISEVKAEISAFGKLTG